MKRILLIIAALSILAFTACGQKHNKEGKQMKTLVTYFSATGTTEAVAKQLASMANADIQPITPEKAYTDADLDWTDKNSRSTIEHRDDLRPAIKKADNVTSYDIIYVGFPIWWYSNPEIIDTFFETYDLSGKTVILFATSGGSTIDKAVQDLKSANPKVNIKGGKLLNNPTRSQLEEFLRDIK